MDEEGIEPKDIELVVSQVNCSRAKAVEALRCLVAVSLCCGQPRCRNRALLYMCACPSASDQVPTRTTLWRHGQRQITNSYVA